jgi:hypothetical protein
MRTAFEVRCPYCRQLFAKSSDLDDHLAGGGCKAAMEEFQKRNEAGKIAAIVEDRIQVQTDRAFEFLRGT